MGDSQGRDVGDAGSVIPTAPARPDVVLALADSCSVGLAAAVMGLAFGVLVAHSGLHWWWASIFAAVIFAGSLEFLLLGLVLAVAPLGQIALTALLVNVRHVFYALSFPLHRVPGVAGKMYSTFALTDEAYAVTATPDAQTWSRGRILWLQAFVHCFWVASVTVGALGGSLIPGRLRGLDFAVTALFAVLAVEAFRARRDIPATLVAVICALVAHVAFGERMLVAGMAMFTTFLLVKYAVLTRWGPGRA